MKIKGGLIMDFVVNKGDLFEVLFIEEGDKFNTGDLVRSIETTDTAPYCVKATVYREDYGFCDYAPGDVWAMAKIQLNKIN